MARKHKHTNVDGEAPADPSGTKRVLPTDVDVNDSQDHPAKRTKFDVPEPGRFTDSPHLITTRQKVMSTPDRDSAKVLRQSIEDLSIKKRRRNDGDAEKSSEMPSKRSRLNENVGLSHMSQTQTDESEDLDPSTDAVLPIPAPVAVIEDQDLLPELQHLAGQYEFSTMSILSSAKMESRVRNLLQRVQKFSFANTKAKPGIVILRAKADVASKLCSIVELAKHQIEKEKGRWWQYSKLHGELLQVKPKQTEPARGGKTLSAWSKAHAGEPRAGSEAIIEPKEAPKTGANVEEAVNEEEDGDMEDAFEVMTNPMLRDRAAAQAQNGNGKKVRNTPVMTIFFAMVPVPGLKELYGEQTNS